MKLMQNAMLSGFGVHVIFKFQRLRRGLDSKQARGPPFYLCISARWAASDPSEKRASMCEGIPS